MSLALMMMALAARQSLAVPYPNPLSPASAGRVQCYSPDLARHVCRSIASYTWHPDGSYDNRAIVLLSPTPLVVMESVTPVTIDTSAVCGAIRQQDIDSAIISVNGQKLADADAAPVRAQISTAMASIIGKRICTTYVPDGQQYIAKASIDGVAQPAMDQKVLWVDATDGFEVAP